MDTKSIITKKILMKSILPENAIDNIINELNINDEKAHSNNYIGHKKTISFGKHKGKSYFDIVSQFPTYALWIYDKKINPHRDITKDIMRYLYQKGTDYKFMKYKNHYKKKYYY
jgi:hypothetical protein